MKPSAVCYRVDLLEVTWEAFSLSEDEWPAMSLSQEHASIASLAGAVSPYDLTLKPS